MSNSPAPPAPPAFDWASLTPPMAAPSKTVGVGGSKIDIVKETPEPIRQRAEESLGAMVDKFARAVLAGTRKENVEPVWTVQPVPTEEMGAEFKKLLTRYGKYRPAEGEIPFRQIESEEVPAKDDAPAVPAHAASPMGQVTIRCGEPAKYVVTDAGIVAHKEGLEGLPVWGVRYVVKPFEARKDTARLPGSDK